MNKTFCKFSDIQVGDIFYSNGNQCIKKSTRTALLVEYDRIFYYGKDEVVTTKLVGMCAALAKLSK